MTGSEDDQLEVPAQLFNALTGIRTHVDSCFDDRSVGEANRQEKVARHVGIFIAVYEGLIEVKDKRGFFGGR
jgi:hypothetical protein